MSPTEQKNSASDEKHSNTCFGLRLAVGIVALGYLILWLTAPLIVFLDLPNHLTRAYIIKELILKHSPFLAQHFSFSPCFSPYILGDLILGLLLELTSILVGARLWVLLCFFSLPLALAVYCRAIQLNRRSYLSLVLVTMFLGSHWFFFSGFLNFSAGVSIAFLTLAAWEKMLQAIDKRSRTASAISLLLYSIGVLCSYFMHLAAFFFLSIIIAVELFYRIIGVDLKNKILTKKAVKTALPLAVVGLFHITFALQRVLASAKEGVPTSIFIYRSFLSKFSAVGTMFIRFSESADIALFVIFILALASAVGFRDFRKKLEGKKSKEFLIIAAVVFLAYLALPVAAFDVYDVDNRGLPFFFLMLSLCAFAPESPQTSNSQSTRLPANRTLTTGLLLALTSFNLAYLFIYCNREQNHLQRYLDVVEHVPEKSFTLPVATLPDTGRVQISLHLGSYATALRQSVTPYLFSANRGDPMPYFRYLTLPPAPHLFWYLRDLPVDWITDLPAYDYVIISKPFNPARMPMDKLTPVFENEAAALYQVNKNLL